MSVERENKVDLAEIEFCEFHHPLATPGVL